MGGDAVLWIDWLKNTAISRVAIWSDWVIDDRPVDRPHCENIERYLSKVTTSLDPVTGGGGQMATSWTAKSQLGYQLGGRLAARTPMCDTIYHNARPRRFQFCTVSAATKSWYLIAHPRTQFKEYWNASLEPWPFLPFPYYYSNALF
jgi:hypothetical protein